MGFLNDFANIFLGISGGGGMDASEKREEAFGSHRTITRPRLIAGMRDVNIFNDGMRDGRRE